MNLYKIEPITEEQKQYEIKNLKMLADNYAEDFRIQEVRTIQQMLSSQLALIDFSFMFRTLEKEGYELV